LSPLFGSLYAFLVYKEKPGLATILAAIGSILGITYMFHREFGSVDVGGLLITLGTPLFMGINLAYLRKHDGVNRVGVSMAGGFFGAIIALILGMGKVAVPPSALLPLLAVGIIIVPFAQVLISMGARYISGAESALITSLETVFGILYVWIFLGEIPHKDILTGGAFVLLCITANTLYHAHKEGAR
ncbi:MAG: DMT family transporter, partial [Sphaerochaeta sp.]